MILQEENGLLHLLDQNSQSLHAVVLTLFLSRDLLAAAAFTEHLGFWTDCAVFFQEPLLHRLTTIFAFDEHLRAHMGVSLQVLAFDGCLALGTSD